MKKKEKGWLTCPGLFHGDLLVGKWSCKQQNVRNKAQDRALIQDVHYYYFH